MMYANSATGRIRSSKNPIAGLGHLQSKMINGNRVYDIAADAEMYPRYQYHERARFNPLDRDMEGIYDVVLHFADGSLLVRGLSSITGDYVDTYTLKQRSDTGGWSEIHKAYAIKELKGIYPIRSKIMTRHHPDYQKG